MKKTLLTLLGLAAVSLAGVNAQVFTGTFSFNASSGNTTSLNYNGNPISNLTISALTKNGVTNSSSTNNFRASDWALDPVVGTLTGVVDTSKYFEFSLSSTSHTINMTSLTFGLGRSGTGPRNFEWRSSVDSFASSINNYTSLNASVTNTSGVLLTPDANAGYTGNTLSLANATFQDLSSVTFRFYAFNSESSSGTGGFQGDLTFSGELQLIPEPSTWALIGLGTAFVLWRIRRKRSAA